MGLKKNPARKYKLYCIIDDKVINKKSPVKIARALFKNGVKIVQLRYKNCPSYKLVPIAEKIRPLAKKYRGVFLINDRPDVALAARASGAHLGSGDMPTGAARALLGQKAVIGRTVHSVKEAKEIGREKIDYVSAGPVFATPLKKNLKGRGIKFIKNIKKEVSVPVFAIGGINKGNIKKLLENGINKICVTRAIFEL